MIQFYDEINLYDANGNLLGSACNPLPAGIVVSFYGGTSVTPASYTGVSGYVTLGGVVNVSLQASTQYTAVFTGAQAPTVYGIFETDSSGNASTPNLMPGAPGAPCSVIGYRSPALSSLGYTIEGTNLWPQGWFEPSAMQPGGNAFPVAAGFGNVLGVLDYMAEALLMLERLQTIAGASFALNTTFNNLGKFTAGSGYTDATYASKAIDSWAYDFFGSLWVRQSGMTDTQWVAVIEGTLQIPKLTLSGIQQILTLWAPWYTGAVGGGASQSLGLDIYGGTDITIPAPSGSTPTFFDTGPGASGLVGRQIIVFDSSQMASPNPVSGQPPVLSSSATLNAYLATPLVPGQICVYFRNPAVSDSGIAGVSIPNYLLNLLVQNWKAAGVGYIIGGVTYPCLFAEN